MPVIFPFGEGKTERIIFGFLVAKWFPDEKFKNFISIGGKDKFREEIINTVQSEVSAGRDEVRIVVFRDLDDGEKIESILQSFGDIVNSLVRQWDVDPLMSAVQDRTVYKWQVHPDADFVGLRLVLHIANHEGNSLPFPLRNQTSDGYILRLALEDNVLERFAPKVAETGDGKVSSEVLRHLVTSQIPEVVRGVNIRFNEDKDYLSAYLTATRFWVVKRTEEKALLVKIILDRAWNHSQEQFEQIFASWRVAIEEAAG